MANDEVTQSPREKRYGYAIQTTFGTEVADAAAFTEVDVDHTQVNRDVKVIEIPGAHGSRQQNAGDMLVHNKNAMPTMPWDIFVKKEEAAEMLAAMMQNVVEGALTPFDKTYTFLATQPDFQANAGYFFTLIERDPVAASSTKMVDAIAKSMTITLAGDEPMKASIEWIGKAIPSITSDPSGTWTRNALTNLFHRSDADVVTVDYGAGALSHHLVAFELAMSQDVVGVGQDGAGGFATYSLSSPVHTIKLTLVKDSDYQTAMTNHAAGTAIDFRVGWGNATPGTVDGDLDFAGHVILEDAQKQHDDPMTVELSGRLVKDGATEPLTTILADSVDRTW